MIPVQTAKIQYTVIGRTAPPPDPKNFRIQAVPGVAMFQWAPATDLDANDGSLDDLREDAAQVNKNHQTTQLS